MSKVISKVYENYEEQPYISPTRDLKKWEENPGDFHYGVIEKKKMIRLPEGILPGHIIMLWRIHFGNFTNETWIPEYFEYRYGVDSDEVIAKIKKKDYIEVASATESLGVLTIPKLKIILGKYKLSDKGKKDELLNNIKANIKEPELSKLFTKRLYKITDEGTKVLAKYNDIIMKHGLHP
jgi:hypothetical protein